MIGLNFSCLNEDSCDSLVWVGLYACLSLLSAAALDSLAVEMSSYVLLAVLTTSPLSAAELGYASRIVSWLVKQQNAYGGFSSTQVVQKPHTFFTPISISCFAMWLWSACSQDTVVALQALALYSTKVFNPDGASMVTVQPAGRDKHHFDVNQNNKLVYQETALQKVPGNYSIEVKGSGCASVLVSVANHTACWKSTWIDALFQPYWLLERWWFFETVILQPHASVLNIWIMMKSLNSSSLFHRWHFSTIFPLPLTTLHSEFRPWQRENARNQTLDELWLLKWLSSKWMSLNSSHHTQGRCIYLAPV